MKKIDIHCHILPGIDDGASDGRESMQMLRLAAEQGFRKVIATPHCSEHFPDVKPDRVRNLCRKLERAARKRIDPEFEVFPGNEILCTAYSMERIQRHEVLSLADSRYILLEFLPAVSYSELFRSIRLVLASQYTPVVAHIERYGALREEGRVEELIGTGARMQMNYRPVGGKWHNETTRWCRKMLKQGAVHLLGTDMHNTEGRSPETEKAMEWMKGHLTRKYQIDLCYKNAEKIIRNDRI